MGYFDDTQSNSRWRNSYNYAYDSVQQSPTIFTAILTLIACITSVWSGMETVGTVAGPAMTAILFLAHNIHQRKAHQEVSDALEEIKAARREIGVTQGSTTLNAHMTINTQETVSAAKSAANAEASAARTEALVNRINQRLAEMEKK